jgi:Fe-S-cluster-containing hydrogenase component 2
MSEGVATTGSPSIEELEKSPGFPSKERLLKGPVAVIECVQEIPCDVCGSACPFDAIKVASISSLPELYEDKCTGCGTCIPLCPGLAIFLVDYTLSRDEALISFPYEFLPVPEVGAIVDATDRQGKSITRGRIVKVLEREQFNSTLVVSIAVPKKFAQEVRGIALPKGE